MHTQTPRTPAKRPLASGSDYATLGNSRSQKCHTPPPGSGSSLCPPWVTVNTHLPTGSCMLRPLRDRAQGWGQEGGVWVSEGGLCQGELSGPHLSPTPGVRRAVPGMSEKCNCPSLPSGLFAPHF